MSRSAEWRIKTEWIVRAYPEIAERKKEALAQKITPSYDGAVGRSEAQRTTERTALNGILSDAEERTIYAVETALHLLAIEPNGKTVTRAIKLMHLRSTRFSAERISRIMSVNVNTVKRWDYGFLRMVWALYNSGNYR